MPWQKGAFAEQAAKWKVYDRMRTRWWNGSRSANGMWHEWNAHTHTTQIVVCASECRRKMTVLCVFFGGGCEPDCSIYLYAPIVFMHNRKFHYATTTFSFIAWVFFFSFELCVQRLFCGVTRIWVVHRKCMCLTCGVCDGHEEPMKIESESARAEWKLVLLLHLWYMWRFRTVLYPHILFYIYIFMISTFLCLLLCCVFLLPSLAVCCVGIGMHYEINR